MSGHGCWMVGTSVSEPRVAGARPASTPLGGVPGSAPQHPVGVSSRAHLEVALVKLTMCLFWSLWESFNIGECRFKRKAS